MRALSIRQPWAWLITRPDIIDPDERAQAAADGRQKLLENRSWMTKFRGTFLIHASAGMTRGEYADALRFALLIDPSAVRNIPLPGNIERGGIVGMVDLVDCQDTSDSPWYMGEKALILADARPLPFTPYKGRLGFFDVPDHLVAGLGVT